MTAVTPHQGILGVLFDKLDENMMGIANVEQSFAEILRMCEPQNRDTVQSQFDSIGLDPESFLRWDDFRRLATYLLASPGSPKGKVTATYSDVSHKQLQDSPEQQDRGSLSRTISDSSSAKTRYPSPMHWRDNMHLQPKMSAGPRKRGKRVKGRRCQGHKNKSKRGGRVKDVENRENCAEAWSTKRSLPHGHHIHLQQESGFAEDAEAFLSDAERIRKKAVADAKRRIKEYHKKEHRKQQSRTDSNAETTGAKVATTAMSAAEVKSSSCSGETGQTEQQQPLRRSAGKGSPSPTKALSKGRDLNKGHGRHTYCNGIMHMGGVVALSSEQNFKLGPGFYDVDQYSSFKQSEVALKNAETQKALAPTRNQLYGREFCRAQRSAAAGVTAESDTAAATVAAAVPPMPPPPQQQQEDRKQPNKSKSKSKSARGGNSASASSGTGRSTGRSSGDRSNSDWSSAARLARLREELKMTEELVECYEAELQWSPSRQGQGAARAGKAGGNGGGRLKRTKMGGMVKQQVPQAQSQLYTPVEIMMGGMGGSYSKWVRKLNNLLRH